MTIKVMQKTMKSKELKKLVIAAMFVAIAVALSPFSIPIAGSKCFPIQHMINVLGAIFLGPAYGVGVAFSTSLIRNLMGTGSVLAFPGSMIGAFCCGMIFKYSKNLIATFFAEVIGTGIIGGLLAYPIAMAFLGTSGAAYMFVIPFLISTAGGTLIAAAMVGIMSQLGALAYLKRQIEA